MPIAARIDVVNPFPADLQRLHKKLGDFRPELSEGKKAYAQHVDIVFQTHGAAGGSSWPALSPMRQRIRGSQRVGWETRPILVWDGDLVDVATFRKTSGDKVAGGSSVRQHEMRLSISGPKVANQSGESRGKFVTPPRPFWPFGRQEHELFFKPFLDWANGVQIFGGP